MRPGDKERRRVRDSGAMGPERSAAAFGAAEPTRPPCPRRRGSCRPVHHGARLGGFRLLGTASGSKWVLSPCMMARLFMHHRWEGTMLSQFPERLYRSIVSRLGVNTHIDPVPSPHRPAVACRDCRHTARTRDNGRQGSSRRLSHFLESPYTAAPSIRYRSHPGGPRQTATTYKHVRCRDATDIPRRHGPDACSLHLYFRRYTVGRRRRRLGARDGFHRS